MEKRPTKADLRKQLQTDVASYVKKGGEIDQVPKGVSGRDANTPILAPLFDTPKTERTYVNDVVANVDARRKGNKSPNQPLPGKKKPVPKIIYDDFGEPVRKVWGTD